MCKISLCMIVKNEEKVLARCLSSAKSFVDEIVIVDTGSTDKTVQIATDFGCRVFDFEWCDNFAKARNFAFSKAKFEYIMWLDADDVVPKATANFLKKSKNNFVADCYMLKYNVAFCDDKPTFCFFRERIVKNCKQAVWQGCVHECIAPFGKIEYLDHAIEHRKVDFGSRNRNLHIYQKTKKLRQLNAREQYYYARELFDHKRYKSSLKNFKIFLQKSDAWVENKIDALFVMAECCKHLGREQEGLSYLFQSFLHDKPRANICSKIGDYFLQNQQYQTAVFWYDLATKCKPNKYGFCQTQYFNFYPYLQMCVCEYKMGNIKKAMHFNKMAEKFFPNSVAVKNNNQFFEKFVT